MGCHPIGLRGACQRCGGHGVPIGLLEHTLDDLLLLRIEDVGKVAIKLRLFALEDCGWERGN